MGVGLVFDDGFKINGAKLGDVVFDREIFDESVVFDIASNSDAKEGTDLRCDNGTSRVELAFFGGGKIDSGIVTAGEGGSGNFDHCNKAFSLAGGEGKFGAVKNKPRGGKITPRGGGGDLNGST